MNFSVTSTKFVIEIEPNPSIRKRVFDFEDELAGHFRTPFRVISVPDNVDPTVPRFESDSLNGHSLIQVSGTRLQMITNYKENYSSDLDKISEYITERAPLFNKLLKQEKKSFIALIFDLAYEMDQDEINGFIKTNSGLNAVRDNSIDVHLLYSMPFAEKYFLNVKCSKFINANFKVAAGSVVKEEQKYGIQVTIDMNSRLHLQQGHSFDEGLVNELSEIIFDLIKNNDLVSYLSGDLHE